MFFTIFHSFFIVSPTKYKKKEKDCKTSVSAVSAVVVVWAMILVIY